MAYKLIWSPASRDDLRDIVILHFTRQPSAIVPFHISNMR